MSMRTQKQSPIRSKTHTGRLTNFNKYSRLNFYHPTAMAMIAATRLTAAIMAMVTMTIGLPWSHLARASTRVSSRISKLIIPELSPVCHLSRIGPRLASIPTSGTSERCPTMSHNGNTALNKPQMSQSIKILLVSSRNRVSEPKSATGSSRDQMNEEPLLRLASNLGGSVPRLNKS